MKEISPFRLDDDGQVSMARPRATYAYAQSFLDPLLSMWSAPAKPVWLHLNYAQPDLRSRAIRLKK